MAATTLASPPTAAPAKEVRRRGWLVGPWFDLLLLANVAWPLYLLLQVGDGFSAQAGLQFWQLYYITTPHRWITLLLVFGDRERLRQGRMLFAGIASAVVVVCLGVRLTTGALTCLLAIDYLWNSWHFAAQHHGIYRIYQRLGEPLPASGLALEKIAMRGFLLYVILRVASATWSDAAWNQWLQRCDWLASAVPAFLILRLFARGRTPGSGAYLLSVCSLYLALLWAVHARRLELVLPLATASALFHALEYLALVSWSVQQRDAALGGRLGLLSYLAPRWALTLATFVVVLGAAAWFMDTRFVETWLTLNVIAAFLHYAYDGLIWRRHAAAT